MEDKLDPGELLPGGIESITDAQHALDMADDQRKLPQVPARFETQGKLLERAIELGLAGYSETVCWALTRYFHYYTPEGPELAPQRIKEILSSDGRGNAALLFQQALLRLRFMSGDTQAVETALQNVDASIAVHPCPAAFSLRAGIHRSLGRSHEALADCDAGLSIERSNVRLLFQRSNLRLAACDWAGALTDAEEAIGLGKSRQDRKVPGLYEFRIVALIHLGRIEDAKEAARELKAFDAETPWVQNDLPSLRFHSLPELVNKIPALNDAVRELLDFLSQ